MKIFEKLHLTKNKVSGITLIIMGAAIMVFFQFIPPSEFVSDNPQQGISFDGFLRYLINMPFSSIDFSLLIINIGLNVIIFSKEFYEDERIEKIRNYCFKQAFKQFLVTFILLGLIIININLLIAVFVIQIYYYFLFRLCIYRDSAIVYASEGDLQKFLKDNKKIYLIILYTQGIVAGIIGGFWSVYKPDSYMFLSLMTGCIIGTIQIIGIHWKSDSLTNK